MGVSARSPTGFSGKVMFSWLVREWIKPGSPGVLLIAR